MAALDLEQLYKKYEGFYYPIARVYIGGSNPEEDKKLKIQVIDYVVEITSDLKAGIASFSLTNVYNSGSGSFKVKDLKKYISLGLDVKILMGHGSSITEVFKGYIARVDFEYNNEITAGAYIRITAMDIKGIMMANNNSKRLKANYYCDAVKEILDKSTYQALKNANIVDSISISNTPDKPEGGGAGQTPDIRIEMVAESDYEFVVKAAKKFNFEFFTIGGNIAFRKAKANTQELAEITPSDMIITYNIGYDITGLVGEVKVRTLDIGKASKIEVKKKNTGKFSLGSKAKPLISGQSYVYIDSSIETQAEAEKRAEYILEDISYRLGSLSMTLKGMPEFVPGRFIKLKGFGDGISNTYYITDVIHEFDNGGKYVTTILGKASTL
ncbi:MAG: phage late control D family protein [Butyrivibrio sp.]|nr:phage late control D family protein [Butyrivibrio sp.]